MKILTRNWGVARSAEIETYEASGGYAALRKALGMKPEAVVDEVKQSNLRGRGGAGFPTGVKWSFVPRGSAKPVFLCVNADEGEPGTFKDRYVIELDPHMLIEGAAISAYAIDAHVAYIYIRGEYRRPAETLEKAISQAYAKGCLGKSVCGTGFGLDLYVHRGAGAYVCGEETSLIESIEGKRGYPRLKPPFPASVGVFKGPTIVNNVETIACVPHIIERGGAWFAQLGCPKNGGTKLFAVSGHVAKPGVYELPLGISLRSLLFDHCGGMRNGGALKAVIPGGISTPILRAEEIDVSMDCDSLAARGTMLGSAAVIVMDEKTCMARSLARLCRFYAHESCGQCTPCREGTSWMAKIAAAIEAGKGRPGDVELLEEVASNILGNTICPLGDAAAMPVISFIKKFKDEFERHVKEGKCPFAPYPVAPSALHFGAS